jgi:hypothetical protein
MKTKYTDEAERVLSEFLGRALRDGTVDPQRVYSVEDESEHSTTSQGRTQAHDYAKARNQNLKPLRQINEADENAREGRDSALAFLEKRRRSVVRR